MPNLHIDMNEEIQRILRNRQAQSMFYNSPSSVERQKRFEESMQQCIRENMRVPEGCRQKESTLRFIIDRDTERAIEDAEANNIIYDYLGEHRILGHKRHSVKKTILSK